MCQPNQSSSQGTSSWLKNELYEFTDVDREILENKDGWLNDNVMDAGQQFICMKLPEKRVDILPSFWRPYSVIT